MAGIRIQKLLAEAGVASRRAVEQMVLDGRITVNRSPVTALPCFVDPDAGDQVHVDGQLVRLRGGRCVYFLVNKPRGVVCTQQDPAGRPRVIDLVPGLRQRVYCVGRLDLDSTGLVILTNDGPLTQRLTHPRYGVPKTYVVQIDGRLSAEEVAKLKRGVHLDGRRTGAAAIKVLRRGRDKSLLQVTLTEGRNREIRRILARLGHKVRRLKRTAIGPVTDRGLKVGSFRPLRAFEVAKLRRLGAAGPQGGRRPKPPTRRKNL